MNKQDNSKINKYSEIILQHYNKITWEVDHFVAGPDMEAYLVANAKIT